MRSASYESRRGELETYFDRTAADAWARLTSDAPVSRIRATVRAGRDTMRSTLLDWLPQDLRGRRVLDAGCGTGALAVEAAKRGARVVAVDISGTLVGLAKQRAPAIQSSGNVEFLVGDMLDASLGTFDHVVAMDSLIHYDVGDILRVLSTLAARTRCSMAVTFAPRTPALAAMHAVGRLFPRGDRAPALQPVAESALVEGVRGEAALAGFHLGRSQRVSRGFYTSQALELVAR